MRIIIIVINGDVNHFYGIDNLYVALRIVASGTGELY
jgi:hypothetical protein